MRTDSPRQAGLLGGGQSWESTSGLLLRPVSSHCWQMYVLGRVRSSYLILFTGEAAVCWPYAWHPIQQDHKRQGSQRTCRSRASQLASGRCHQGSSQRTTLEGQIKGGVVDLKPVHSSRVGKTHILKGRAYAWKESSPDRREKGHHNPLSQGYQFWQWKGQGEVPGACKSTQLCSSS